MNKSSTIDVSREAQLANIEASFAAAQQYSEDNAEGLENLRHPTKPGLKAVESYPLLPDADIWANAYDLFRFAERPGERPVDVRPYFLRVFIV
jgi:RNA polymerase II-associated factor 1